MSISEQLEHVGFAASHRRFLSTVRDTEAILGCAEDIPAPAELAGQCDSFTVETHGLTTPILLRHCMTLGIGDDATPYFSVSPRSHEPRNDCGEEKALN
jgi:hypothetical protein